MLDPVHRMATPSAAHRGRHPAVPARQRRPLRRIFQPDVAAGGARPRLSRSGLTDLYGRAGAASGRRPRADRPERVVRAVRAARSTRASASGTAPTSCSRPAGRHGPRRRCCWRAAAPAPTSSRTTSRSSSPTSARVACSPSDTYRHGPLLHRRQPVAAGPRSSTATAPPPTPSSSASTTTLYRPRDGRSDRRDTVVFYARDGRRRAAPSRSA